MRLVTYRRAGRERLGAMLGDWIVDLHRAYRAYLKFTTGPDLPSRSSRLVPLSMLALLTLGESSVEAARAALSHVQALLSDPTASKALRAQGILIPRAGISLAAPVPRPGKVICIGLNYPSGQPGAARSQYPVVFLKPASGLIGPDEPIRIPIVARDVAFEAELAVVIGTRAKHLSPARALDCVFGYTLANDVGARDLEQRTSQWTTGKLMDSFHSPRSRACHPG